MPTKSRKLEILSQDKATKKVKTSQNILTPRICKWKGPPNNQLSELFVCIIRNFIYNQKAVIRSSLGDSC